MELSGESLPPGLWRLLWCIFDLESADPVQIAEHLESKYRVECNPKLAGVLLLRLVERGFVRAAPRPRAGRGRPLNVYTATMSREAALQRQMEAILDQYLIREGKDLDIVEAVLQRRRAAAAPS